MNLIWDSVVTGLHTKNDSYYFYYRINGAQRRPKIGSKSVLSLAQARTVARAWAAKIAAGTDPSLERQLARHERTVAEAFEAAWFAHWGTKRFKESGHAKIVFLIWSKHVAPLFGGKKLSTVRAPVVRAWHRSLSETPVVGNRALEILSKVFSFAIEEEWIPQHTNPCAIVRGFKERKRERVATPKELAEIGKAFDRHRAHDPAGVLFLELLFLTGARPSAIARAKYKDITRSPDGCGSVLHFGKESADSGMSEILTLSPEALTLIDRANVDRGAFSDGTIAGSFPRSLWNRIRKEAGCPDLWARDSRRTFASIGLSSGESLDALAECLNHASTQTTKIYARLSKTTRETTTKAVSDRVSALLNSRPADLASANAYP
jgi:integrase